MSYLYSEDYTWRARRSRKRLYLQLRGLCTNTESTRTKRINRCLRACSDHSRIRRTAAPDMREPPSIKISHPQLFLINTAGIGFSSGCRKEQDNAKSTQAALSTHVQ